LFVARARSSSTSSPEPALVRGRIDLNVWSSPIALSIDADSELTPGTFFENK
jgi:hypothetical protein